MKFIPARKDTKIRIIYSALLIGAIICFSPIASGIIHTVMQSLGIVVLTSSLAIFIKYESTTFSYILIEKNGHFDFYIDKHVGKRGAYVCYFPVSDAVKIVKLTDTAKDELRTEYENIYFYNYGKNVFCGEKHIIVFKNESKYDAVIFEPDEKFVTLIKEDMEKHLKEADAE